MRTIEVMTLADTVYALYDESESAWGFGSSPAFFMIGWGSIFGGKGGAGVMFENVTIPQGAVITSAYVKVRCFQSQSNVTVNAYVTGDKEANAATWTSWADYATRRGTVVGGADNSKRTIAQVAWNSLPAWTEGVWYQTPDITSIIQEIVNQVGWVSGNNLALWIDDHDDRSTHSSYRYGTLKNGYYDYPTDPGQMTLHVEFEGNLMIQTDPATNIQATSAVLNGTLLNDGDDTPVNCAFDYGLTTEYGSAVAFEEVAEGNSFSALISGLLPNRLYHFRAKAKGASDDTVYGIDRTFRTSTSGLTGYVTRIVREYKAGVYKSTIFIGGDFNRNVPSKYGGLKE